jgi:hypothetical protein
MPKANGEMLYSPWYPGWRTRLLEGITGVLWLVLWSAIAIDHGELMAFAAMMSLQG